jgi:pimeloyl-ACP methyl ester carboxylesterase
LTERVAVVFIHGLFSSARTWAAFNILMRDDHGLGDFDRFEFEYWSPFFRFNPLRRIPNYSAIADTLLTFLETRTSDYRKIVLVTHSQGGLIVQRYLARRLAGGHGEELRRIRQIVMYACPNNGSQALLALRKHARFWVNPQERALRPFDEEIHQTRRIVHLQVVNATETTSSTAPIPVAVYAGSEDGIVPLPSAQDVFPDAAALPGDHSTIIRPDSPDHLSYLALRRHLLQLVESRHDEPGLTPALTENWRTRALVEEDALFGIDEPLEELRPWITGTDPMCIVSIFGTGGAGKTTMAYEAVKRYAVPGSFTRVAWVSAKSSELTLAGRIEQTARTSFYWRELLADIAEQLALTVERAPTQIEKNFADGLSALSHAERCLIVVDNLESMVDAKYAVEYLDRHDAIKRHRVLLTTRDSVLPYTVHARQKEWNRLPDGPARHLVAHLGRNDPGLGLFAAEIDEVVQAAGGNPLVIKLIMRLCIDRKQTVAEVVRRIRADAAARGTGLASFLYHSSIEALYERVGEEDGANLLNVFCPLAPGTTIDVEEFYRRSGIESRERFDEAKAAAGRLALLTASQGNARFAVHSLLQAFFCGS